MHNPEYITSKELAARWRVTTHALDKMRSRGTGPPYTKTPGGHARYDMADVVAYEEKNKTVPIREDA